MFALNAQTDLNTLNLAAAAHLHLFKGKFARSFVFSLTGSHFADFMQKVLVLQKQPLRGNDLIG